MIRFLVLLFFAAPLYGSDIKLKELSPAKSEPAGVIPVEVERYRWYSVQDYSGPVTWMAEGTSVGMKEVGKELTLFGTAHGQSEPGEYPIPAGALIVWGRSEGLTKAQAWGVVDGKAKQLLTLSFLVGPAPPKPDPKPIPDPKPVKGKLHGYIVVEETSTSWPERGLTMATTAAWADANKVARRWVDQNVKDVTGNPPKDMAPWLNRAKGKNLPMVYLVTEKGEILFEGELPLTSDGFLTLLKKYKEAK